METQLRTMYSKVAVKEVGKGVNWIQASESIVAEETNELSEFITNERLA